MFESIHGLSYLFSHEDEIVTLGDVRKGFATDVRPLRRTSMMVDWFVKLKAREQKMVKKIFPLPQTALIKN